VSQNRFDHLGPDAQDRVERHHRILEDHGDAAAPEVAHLPRREPHEILAVEEDAPADYPSGRVEKAED